ncbi:hypothetical protein XENTR_v10002493 [Xenopus tropicalis]|nr:hypothetical protein XENTR_v10002493 [Xenopus tropicalis]
MYLLCIKSVCISVLNIFLFMIKSLKRIDRCQMSRLGQLNEEKKQFALLMKRRLTPKSSSRLISLAGERDSIRSFSAKTFRDLTSAKNSIESFETVSTVSSYRTDSTASKSSNSEGKKWRNHTSHLPVRREYSSTILQEKRCQYGETAQLLVRSESCFPRLGSENISKAAFLTTRGNS